MALGDKNRNDVTGVPEGVLEGARRLLAGDSGGRVDLPLDEPGRARPRGPLARFRRASPGVGAGDAGAPLPRGLPGVGGAAD